MLKSHKPTIECKVRKLMPNGKFELIQQHSDIQKEDNKIIMEQSYPDGTGKEVTEIPMRSFLPNFMKMIANSLQDYPSDYQVIKTDGGVLRLREINIQTAGLAGWDNRGIVLGKGKTAISKSDYALTDRIPEGSGTNQLNHGICNFAVTEGENSSTLKFIRTFSNNSEADIAIGECGIYADHYNWGSVFMICRDLLNEGNDYIVTAGKVLTITYQFTIDSSSFFTDNWLYLIEKGFMHDAGTQYESGVTYVDNLRPALGNNVQHYFYQPSSMNLFRSVTSGIVLGTSTEAFALTNRYYGATSTNDKLIPHGNSEGQLQHYIATTDGYTENGDDMMWNVKKIFTNNTANPISVTELYMRILSDSVGYADGYYARKRFTPPITIDPNASMEFEVIHKITLG